MRKMFLTVMFCTALAAPALAQAPVPIGAMGDSTTDSYRAEDNRGGTYRLYTFNYIELLVRTGRIDAGRWAYYREPRRTDYSRNWARSGATSYSLLSAGQHTGLAAQVRSTPVTFVMLSIGANDFHYSSSYRPVYDGTLSGAALQTKITKVAQNKILAANTLLDAGTNVVILPVGDYGLTPSVIAMYPDPVKRARVSSAIAQINTRVEQYFANNPAVVLITTAESLSIISAPKFLYGGVMMNCAVQGDYPTYCILKDKHAGTILSGILANMFIAKVNAQFGAGILPLTETEVLKLAGLVK